MAQNSILKKTVKVGVYLFPLLLLDGPSMLQMKDLAKDKSENDHLDES